MKTSHSYFPGSGIPMLPVPSTAVNGSFHVGLLGLLVLTFLTFLAFLTFKNRSCLLFICFSPLCRCLNLLEVNHVLLLLRAFFFQDALRASFYTACLYLLYSEMGKFSWFFKPLSFSHAHNLVDLCSTYLSLLTIQSFYSMS